MNFENKISIGSGCYTAPEIAHILQLPYSKVRRWMVDYWDGKLGKEFESKYSWTIEGSRAVSFHTLIEFYVMMQLSSAGVKPKDILKAHQKLSEDYNTAFPFATKRLIKNIKTDGRTVYIAIGENTISLDGTNQLNLPLIKEFFKNLEFDGKETAQRFWPRGKDKSVVIDPLRKFGHPIIEGYNIYPEILYNHFKAGDPIHYLTAVYNLSEKEIKDAIDYCSMKTAA